MQVLCKRTEGNAEIHCCVCGQGFLIFWERQSRPQRAEALTEIQRVLRGHHRVEAGPDAHTHNSFLVPEWDGPTAFAGAAVPGHAPTWGL